MGYGCCEGGCAVYAFETGSLKIDDAGRRVVSRFGETFSFLRTKGVFGLGE